MITYEETAAMLDDTAAEIPEEFYRELNGGIVLSPDKKLHPQSYEDDPLYIVGEYYNDRKGYGGLGRYIIIYFGSFEVLYAHLPPKMQRKKLREVLLHEFTHHLESLAGERDLEIKDVVDLARYKIKKG
jgi:Mlc titration factor MtfA (ptsG expression regulator)